MRLQGRPARTAGKFQWGRGQMFLLKPCHMNTLERNLEQRTDNFLLLHVKTNWIWDPLSIKRLPVGSSCAFCCGSTISHNVVLTLALSPVITSCEPCNQTIIVRCAACSHRSWWSYVSNNEMEHGQTVSGPTCLPSVCRYGQLSYLEGLMFLSC